MNTPNMNRQQRRSAARKKQSFAPVRHIVPSIGLHLLNNARPYQAGEMVDEHIYTRACFERLRDGSGTEADFDRLSMIFNTGLVRAESIESSIVATMQAGQEAMCRMKDRYLRGLRFGFDAQGVQDAISAMDDYEVVMDASSPLQMKAAIQTAYGRIMGGEVLMIDQRRVA